jgi:hypothetical protein
MGEKRNGQDDQVDDMQEKSLILYFFLSQLIKKLIQRIK